MGFDADWAVAASEIYATLGVAAVITRPAPNNTPVTTRVIWLPARQESQPFGTSRSLSDPRKFLSVPRSSDLPTLPAGSLIVAPELEDGPVKTWRVEGPADPVTADEQRVIVIEV